MPGGFEAYRRRLGHGAVEALRFGMRVNNEDAHVMLISFDPFASAELVAWIDHTTRSHRGEGLSSRPLNRYNVEKCPYFRYDSHYRISLTEGRIPDAILTAERVRMPARGLANRSRAALGQRKQVYAVCARANCYAAGTRTGPYGA